MLNYYLRQWGQALRLTPTFILEPIKRHKERVGESRPLFLYKENHSLYEWFKKAYGDE